MLHYIILLRWGDNIRKDPLANINSSGGLISSDFLKSLRQENFNNPYIRPETFSVPGEPPLTQKQLNEQMISAWQELLERWDEFSFNVQNKDTTEARKKWILPLLRILGFKPVYQPQDIVISEDKRLKFNISYRGFPEERDPMIHAVSPSEDLDVRNGNDRNEKSPHDTLQIFLNVDKKSQWGLLTNGILLRILRDFYHTSTKGYVEFDLENIFTERSFSDFRALYRMVHASRFSKNGDNTIILEHFYKESCAAGVKVGEDLRGNVKLAIETLGNGFLTEDLVQRMISDEKFCKEYYEELLTLTYRILFLLFEEQRGILPSRDSLYAEEYSITSLRERAENFKINDKYADIWYGLKVTFKILKKGYQKLNVFPYNGSLFDDDRLKTLSALECKNEDLLTAVHYLTWIEKDKVLQRISYLDLGVEEIGSIYESLLDLIPSVLAQDGEVDGKPIRAKTFFLDSRGTARKTTGSYYTDKRLVDELIKSALIPVAQEKISSGKTSLEKEKALLSLRVCDPACGSGAFLIAATMYLGKELAQIRTGTEYPSDKEEQRARREILQHCIYGVDLNPMAVELAKVSLWINAVVEDMPLNFLDHHIKCGNSLIGTTPTLLSKGIPDTAFTPVEGDDKAVAKEIININKKQKKSQSLAEWETREEDKKYIEKFNKLNDLPEDNPEDVENKKICYNRLMNSYLSNSRKLIADTWTAAFFWPLTKETRDAPTGGFLRMLRESGESAVDKNILNRVKALAQEYKFFHWYLEFPDVFQRESFGFDCVLGNPPWEIVKPNSQEFFSLKDPEFRSYTKQKAKKVMDELRENNKIDNAWKKYERIINKQSLFYRESNSFPNIGRGDINTFKLFLEQFFKILKIDARFGILVPSGIYTDQGCLQLRKLFFDNSQIQSLYCFENKLGIFPIHRSFKFVLFVTKKGGGTDTFKTAFMLHDPDILPSLEKDALRMIVDSVKKFSPDTLSIMEFKSQRDVDIAAKIYNGHPLLGESVKNAWILKFTREIQDSKILNTESKGVILYEGKMIHQYNHLFSEPQYWVNEIEANSDFLNKLLNQTKIKGNIIQHNLKNIMSENKAYRMCFRRQAASTNERTLISTIIYPEIFAGDNLEVNIPFEYINQECKKLITYSELLVILPIFNSYILDYIVRMKITTNLNKFYIYQLPIPRLTSGNWYFDQLVPRAARLICITEEFADLWNEVYCPEWNLLSVKDGGTSMLEDWSKLTPIWNKECGAYGWDKTKHDTGDRAQLRCEIDALVAHLYGLNKEELKYILSTFPIVKEKSPWLIEGTIKEFDRFESIKRGSADKEEFVELLSIGKRGALIKNRG